MKTISVIKFFTVVSLIVGSQVVSAEGKGCLAKCKYSKYESDSQCADKKDAEKVACINGLVSECKDSCANELDSSSRCKDALKSYSEVAPKSKMACNAFSGRDSEDENKCYQKISSCRDRINGLMDPFGSTDGSTSSNGLDMIKDMALQKIASKSGVDISRLNQSSTSCVKSIDSKQARQDQKDKDKEKKELEKEIKKEYDEMAKLAEKQREKQDDIKKKTNELEAENKKDAANKDVKIREQLAQISKNTVDVGKRLRSYSAAITQEQQKLAKENFDYQTAMLELTDDKINQKCKSEFDALKAALVNSKVNDPQLTSPEQKQLAALAANYRAKGISGTGELKAMLLSTKAACFQKATTARNAQGLNHSQNVKNAQDRIAELNNTMADEKTRLAQDQDNMKKIQDENASSKTDAEKEKLDKLNTLNVEMQNFITSTQEKTQIAQAQVKKLNEDIQKLSLKTKIEVQANFDDAMEAIDKAETARVTATKDCGCDGDPDSWEPSMKETCTMLYKNAVASDDAQDKVFSKKAKNKTSK